MERRQMLKYLMAGGLSAGMIAPLAGQDRSPRPQALAPAENSVQPTGSAQIRDDAVPVVDSRELERVLLDWEKKTTGIKKLRGEHARYEYDSVFQQEKRAVGDFWYEMPDKGRIDFNVDRQPRIPNPPVNPGKVGPNGPFAVLAASSQYWVCDGNMILQVNVETKTYDQLELPFDQKGENIMDGPLPFLFGMKADKIKERYDLAIGEMHDPQGKKNARPQYHIVARPLKPEDAREWCRAEIILDAQFCLPTAIRLLDPAQTKETVYVFDLRKMDAKTPWGLSNPFKPSLRGFQLMQQATKDANPPLRTGNRPGSGAN